MDGELDWVLVKEYNALIKVEEVNAQLKGPNEFGQVFDGSAQVTGKLIKGWIDDNSGGDFSLRYIIGGSARLNSVFSSKTVE